MKVTFNIDYRTNWGESLFIVGDCKELGGNNLDKAIEMTSNGDGTWTYACTLPKNKSSFAYSYLVKNENGYARREWGKPHIFVGGADNFVIYDKWRDQPAEKTFFSSAFTQGIFAREQAAEGVKPFNKSLVIKIFAPKVKSDEVLAICGDIEALGNWNPEKAVVMNDSNFPEWEVAIDLKGVDAPFNYKFVKLNKETLKVVSWEGCDNHPFAGTVGDNECVVVSDLYYVDSEENWKGAGTAIPVFSLRSDEDFGVGDFYDLFRMVDWAKETGQKVLQLLPINDTTMTHTWVDSYPYKANSTFALHPMFLRPDKVGVLQSDERMAYYRGVANELNSLAEIDYEKVNNAKMSYLREIFAENGAKTMKTAAFKAFVKENEYWLKPYAAFCLLRDKNENPDFSEWKEFAVYDAEKVDAFCKENKNEIDFVYYLQYHLDKQLSEARDYAHKNGVVLKGDIPIGISRTSVDAWMYPHLFYMDCQAGAPPDDFSVLGQNWGFPTYNWEEMNKDGFEWWKNRFKKMAQYFDAYRIDHILGFFRIWEIPMTAVHGLLGTFNPALPFTVDELRNSYDFWLNKDLHTKPYIMEYFLTDFFGEFVNEAREMYLEPVGDGRYKLKKFVDNQRKVEEVFAVQPINEKTTKIKNALMGLIDDVLFIEDKEEKDKFHPRISAQFTYIYRSLTDYERWCFDRLYNDFFYHRHNDFWYGKAMWKLPPLINATEMLVCGEDLGMIPDCVSSVMASQQILSLEIQRMPKDPKQEFGLPYQYPYLCVCTTSTHDMSGIRAWWEEDREKTQHFYNNVLHQGGEAPFYAEPWICDKIVMMHLESPAILTILPLQDWLSVSGDLRRNNPKDEQINVPANPKHYWRYRMHLTLETLMEQKAFNRSIRERVQNSGR